jgi:hypothetical protein
MEIVVIDYATQSKYTKENHYLTGQRRQFPDAIPVHGVNSMVNSILGRLSRGGANARIDRLVIVCHGWEGGGGMNVGSGQGEPSRGQRIFIDDHDRFVGARELARLAGHFAPGAVVEIHSCQLARGHFGRELLRQLSDLWGVRVRASPENQRVDAVNAIEGPVIEAAPRTGHHSRVRRL